MARGLGSEQPWRPTAPARHWGRSKRVHRGPGRADEWFTALGRTSVSGVTGWAVALKGEQWDPTVCTGPSERMGVALNEVWDTGGVAAL